MYSKKVTGHITSIIAKNFLDELKPVITESVNWKRWVTPIGPYTCMYCFSQNGKIISINEETCIPVHPNCHCKTITCIAIHAGCAAKEGKDGADYYLKFFGQLPDCYITLTEAKKSGWKAFLESLDALWDSLTGIIETPVELKIIFKPETKAGQKIKPYINRIINVFRDVQKEYGEIKLFIDME